MTTTNPKQAQHARHTPGPWEWGMYTTPADGMVISVVAAGPDGIDRTVCRVSTLDNADTIDSANAALIADSPVMLSVLADLIRRVGPVDDGARPVPEFVKLAARIVARHM